MHGQPKSLRFTKYQALGNDYLVVEPIINQEGLVEILPAAWVRQICDRHQGIGADGILYGPFPADHGVRKVRIFNPDGSEAEKSGNGLRIFARYLWEQGYLSHANSKSPRLSPGEIRIQTIEGIVSAWVLENSPNILVEMGKARILSSCSLEHPSDDPNQPPPLICDGKALLYCAVDLGNPHCVIWYPNATPTLAKTCGPQIETEARFPQRTNVQFLEVIDRGHLRIEIWERGAGYTLASGSSSCAAAFAAYYWGRCDSQVTVQNPGGNLQVTINAGDSITLEGPVKKVCFGVMEI